MLTPAPSHNFWSASSVRGYLSKSSPGQNWIGFTNTETTTLSHFSTAFLLD